MIAKFKKTNRGLAAAAALFAGLGLITLTDAETSGPQANKDLVGTWILVGKPGEVGLAPAEGGRLKSLTETHWSMTQTDPKDGVVIFHHGGTYTLKGSAYVEHVEFANSNTKDRIGKNSKFKIKLEGDMLTLTGVGNSWNEVWKRVPASKPHKLEAANLQGTWTGHEEGDRSKGSPSLVIRGSTFEFHGTDNEGQAILNGQGFRNDLLRRHLGRSWAAPFIRDEILKSGYLDQRNPVTIGPVLDAPEDDQEPSSREEPSDN